MRNAQAYAKIFEPLTIMFNYMELNAKIANYRASIMLEKHLQEERSMLID